MEIDLIVHGYGYSKLIFYVLDGLAMFRNSDVYEILVETMVLMVGTFYAWQMAAAGAEGEWSAYIKKCLGMIIFVNSLLLPKASMVVKDHVEKSVYPVDNIPLAFALPIGVIESLGHTLTSGFEQVFSLVASKSSATYYHYGTVFGARLAKEVLEAKIRDPEVVGNMKNFIERCVVLPAMIGYHFTKEELVATHDIWTLLKKNNGTFTKVDMIIDRVPVSPKKTCLEAMTYFEGKFAAQISGIFNVLSEKFRGAGSEITTYKPKMRQLNTNMKHQIAVLYGADDTAVDGILKHNMMINSINNYRSGKFASARAQLHQEAGGLISGDIAEKTLTGSLALMKVIVYSSFIFLLPMLILSGGIARYRGWMTMAFSLSLWPPLYTILNMVIDFAYEPAHIVSYSSWSTEKVKFDSIASLAAGLSLSIPFLAYWIMRMGEGGFMHLAGSVMATAQSASGAIAGEKSSGTRSWDNESIGNTSRNNTNSNKYNDCMEYVSGEMSYNTSDGARVKIAADGTQIISGGAGVTSDVGETRYSMEDSRQAQVNEGASKSQEKLESDTRAHSEAQSNTMTKAKDYVKNLAEREARGETINYEEMGEQGKRMEQMVSTTKSLVKDYGYSWAQAAEGSLTGSISATSPLKNIVGGVSISAEGKISANNTSTQQFNEKESADRQNQAAENYNNVTKAAINQSHSKDQTIDKTDAESVRSAYEEQQRTEKTLQESIHEAQGWQKTKNLISTGGGSINQDMTAKVIDRYMEENGIGDRQTAYRDVMNRTPEAMKVWNKMLNEDHYVQDIHNSIVKSRNDTSKESATKELDNFSQNHQIVEGAYDTKVEEAKKADGFDSGKIGQNIATSKEELTEKHGSMMTQNKDQYTGIEAGIKAQEEGLQAKIDKYEEDRIGQGFTKSAMQTLNMIPGVNLGDSLVGGPSKNDSLIQNKPAVTAQQEQQGPKQKEHSFLHPGWTPYTGKPVNTESKVDTQVINNKQEEK